MLELAQQKLNAEASKYVRGRPHGRTRRRIRARAQRHPRVRGARAASSQRPTARGAKRWRSCAISATARPTATRWRRPGARVRDRPDAARRHRSAAARARPGRPAPLTPIRNQEPTCEYRNLATHETTAAESQADRWLHAGEAVEYRQVDPATWGPGEPTPCLRSPSPDPTCRARAKHPRTSLTEPRTRPSFRRASARSRPFNTPQRRQPSGSPRPIKRTRTEHRNTPTATRFDGSSPLFSLRRLGLHDRSGRDRGRGRALTDSRRGSVQGTTQPFAHLVNILSRPLANDCRSLLVNADGPPVYIPLARNVSMKSRMLSR